MSLFQTSVLKKYLADLDATKVQAAYERFRAHFSDPAKQENIRNAKEEQYQEGFLRELFADTLGYTLHPAPGYNLTTEFKNLTDAKKADGAILLNDAAIAVIELKGTNTTDFKKIEEQAFRYKNNHKGCRYVVTSNFERLRFYVDDATEYEEFDLFTLDYEGFALLFLCLAKTHILAHLPADIKARSVTQEEQITRKLYADYSDFKRKLFTDLCARNLKPDYEVDRLLLFKKTQKLLDRLLFILFAEDRGLLPPNSIHDVLIQWQELRDKYDEPVSLYSRFQKYFGYMNTGYKGQKYDVFGYNGGLFAPDEVLDSVAIDDTVLFNGTWALTRYDFATEVDVNILGHIFEHSLNEIEEIQAELEGRAVDKGKTKRKKDGVFYTPKYITRYIVENTVAALCRQKQAELGLREEDYADRAAAKKKRKELNERLNAYQTWLENITILDPACGSGAFLNQAFNFLSEEHARLDRLRAALFGDALVLRDTDLGILEHNLFGVDLNDESVEIAQLSLWLRTAKKGRKLSTLSQNIRVGNSLIADPAVAGDKAFDWQATFPQVFANGGFDVVVGNPPYGADVEEFDKEYFRKNFPNSTEGKIDTYKIFIELGIALLNKDGMLSFITPNTFLYNIQSMGIRKFILDNCTITDAVELRKNIFQDAPDVVPTIMTIQKHPSSSYSLRARVAYPNQVYRDIDNDKWEIDQIIPVKTFLDDPVIKFNLRADFSFHVIKQKMEKKPRLGDFFDLKQGTKPYGSKEKKEDGLMAKEKIDDSYEKAINGRNISRYHIKFENDYVMRSEALHSCLSLNIINGEKIYFQRMRKISLFPRIVAAYDNENIHGLYTCSVIYKKEERKEDISLLYVLCLINSYLINIWYKYFDTDIEIKLVSVKAIPIPEISKEEQTPFIEIGTRMLQMKQQLYSLTSRFLRLLTSKHPSLALTKKLEDWPSLSFGDFLKEVKKQKIAWNLKEEAEWMDYFAQEQSAAKALGEDIARTDREIDQMVYALYGLTPEEVAVVEGA